MPPRHRILIHSDPTWFKTGLAETDKTLLKWLYKTRKYDLGLYCSQGINENDPKLQLSPWPVFGSIPANQEIINQINRDPMKVRNAVYGSYNIDKTIKEFKPTIYWGNNDSWAFPKSDYMDKPWWNKINSVLYITIDSLPITKEQIEQAQLTKNYFTLTKFARDEMHRLGVSHAQHIYGCIDTTAFSPISPAEKAELRKKFGIDQSALIFVFVFRNQLRKQAPRVMAAFAKFKKEYPNSNAKLLFHTSFSEKGQGWDIPEIAKYRGIDEKDILCTYVCKECGEWFIAPYKGEDIDCPSCGAKRSCVTANIKHGVSGEEMKLVYGVADAGISAFSSGGLEYHNFQSLLCGLPVAITNYTCGCDYCIDETKEFVYPLDYAEYDEHSTNYIKASTSPSSINAFMRQVYKSSKKDLAAAGEKGRDWAVKNFSIENVGPKWEKVFDAMPMPDWEKIDLTPDVKNTRYPFPSGAMSDDEFLTDLYRNILHMEEPPNGEGRKNWLNSLNIGVKRIDVYHHFIKVATEENMKNQVGDFTPRSFESLLDKTDNKRAIFVAKESIGDMVVLSALFKSFHETYPGCDLYVATLPKNMKVLEGNSYIHKLIEYQPFMEYELAMCGNGGPFDVYLNPLILTQRQLGYLFKKEPAYTDLFYPDDHASIKPAGEYIAAIDPSLSVETDRHTETQI